MSGAVKVAAKSVFNFKLFCSLVAVKKKRREAKAKNTETARITGTGINCHLLTI